MRGVTLVKSTCALDIGRAQSCLRDVTLGSAEGIVVALWETRPLAEARRNASFCLPAQENPGQSFPRIQLI